MQADDFNCDRLGGCSKGKLQEILTALNRKTAVEELMERGFAQPTAYRALDLAKSKFKDFLMEKEGLLWWRG